MKDFEKFLTDVPKPDVDVPVFRQQLRRELMSLQPGLGRRSSGRWTLTAAALAAIFALTLVLFVARPGIPSALHASLGGSAPVELDAEDLQQLLTRTELALQEDRRFVDDWTATQERPVAVRQMEGERIVSVRQFELTDGKRMLVFTEIDPAGERPRLMRTASSTPVF